MEPQNPFARTPCVAIRRMYPNACVPSQLVHTLSSAIVRELSRNGILQVQMPAQALAEGDSTPEPAINDLAKAKPGRSFIPLSKEPRECIPTADAAFHLGRKPQTLRVWACNQCGPIEPARVGGRLMWSVKDIKEFLQTPKRQAKDA
jgi:hypothetical protein